MSKKVLSNDNNNFAPSIILSLCEFVSDCFWTSVFFLRKRHSLTKIPLSKPITSHSTQNLKKKKKKKWCAVII